MTSRHDRSMSQSPRRLRRPRRGASCQDEIQLSAQLNTSQVSGSGAAAAQDAGGGQGNLGPEAPTPAAGAGASCKNPSASGRYFPDSACIDSWLEDPVGIHVNELANEVQWTPGSGCANHGAAYASWYAQWVPDGWYPTNNNFYPSFSCSAVVSKSYVIFVNYVFCAGLYTYTDYYPQVIQGFANGGYSWSVSWAKLGACAGLLSWHAAPS
jgi:hypothetical protein